MPKIPNPFYDYTKQKSGKEICNEIIFPTKLTRFKLDEELFMSEVEEPPLFLRKVS
jgi:hypothetical protein